METPWSPRLREGGSILPRHCRGIRGEEERISRLRSFQAVRRRVVGLAAVVLLAFVTCFAPNNFVLLAHIVGCLFYEKSYYHVYKLTLCLSCLNNCLDPFVYYFVSREFQLRLLE
ncbi:P2Y purinoceptor 8 [Saguinus oedipus]|uniref:P2Y purinoceptor 8 n=1 Tax=Saguinus oedipus TaxID=9490 RepID=A0ABQ9TE42_SAGOE|nr:P2Y purinoceptor 8 [Saguinus oedipus]